MTLYIPLLSLLLYLLKTHLIIIIVRGTGYYHLHTREAYQIILRRIERRKKSLQEERAFGIWCCLFVSLAPCGACIILEKNNELKKIAKFESITKLRLNAAGPSSPIDLESHPDLLEEMKKKKRSKKSRNNDRNDNSADVAASGGYIYYGGSDYFNEEVVVTGGAAGCG